uniref:Ubiquitin-conjugating enzyme E2-binding protein n=1 Tax=Talaromyces marneffei PM1 TaxID=1077442 RepID=A0A093VTM9_TALMA
MAATPTIFLHAELLPNIRQLTLHVSLLKSASEIDLRESTITLTESCRAVTVSTHHQGVELVETLKLPVKVTDASRRNLSFAGHRVDIGGAEPEAQTAEYSFRLQVDPNDTGLTIPNQVLQDDDYVPWTASDVSTCVALHCRFCKQTIVDTTSKADTSSPWQWKDLPSGNWAEMMDFWHCHKPDVHPDEKEDQKNIEAQNASVKGYGASNRVVATPRTGLVDVASFLVAESDCHGIKVQTILLFPWTYFSTRRTLLNLVGGSNAIEDGYGRLVLV